MGASGASRTVVVGSGLAGLTAAVRLADAGHHVIIVERSAVVGGRTSSWTDDGMEVESGLHRYLGFYVHLPRVLRHVGARLNDVVTWSDEIEMRMPDGGPRAVYSTSLIHRPVRSICSVAGNNDYLSWGQKLALAQMLAAGVRDYLWRPGYLDRQPLAHYARKYGVTPTTVERILTPLSEGLFFVPPSTYSTYNFMGLMVPYWNSVLKTRVGAFSGGMTDVLCRPLLDYVLERGGEIHTSTEVHGLVVEDDAVTGVRTASGQIAAEHVVLAASLGGAQAIIKASLGDHRWFKKMLRLPSTPSVCFQAELDAPCMGSDHATFAPGTVMASFSEQSRTTFSHCEGRISVILANPASHLGKSADQLAPYIVTEARRVGIDLEGHIKRARVIEIPDDFYSLEVGRRRLRPKQRTPIAGLALAGDYTRQKYLATMEGAVVSGEKASEVILRRAA